MGARPQKTDGVDGRPARRDPIPDECARLAGHRDLENRLSQARRAGRRFVIVGVGAGADDRRVADAARPLVHGAAGRGAGGDVSLRVHRDGADGADLAAHAVGAFLERQRVQLLPAGALPGRDQRRIRNRGDSALACKRLRPGAAEKNMGRVVADAARGEDGVLHRLHAGDGTRPQRRPVHAARVQLHFAFAGERGAGAGVEEGIVLQDHRCRLGGVQGGASLKKHA